MKIPHDLGCRVAEVGDDTKAAAAALEDENRVVFRYVEASNPNGSLNDIAGICNAAGNVIGMMPHPENMIEPLHGDVGCLPLFESLLEVAA